MIFNFYVVPYQDVDFIDAVFGFGDTIGKIESWQLLVHVCRRWRGLVFESPRRLNLRLYCTPGASASQTSQSLDVWPALPLLINGDVFDESVDNVIAELKHSDRISQISLACHTSSQFEKLWTAMQVPFPNLASLYLYPSFGESSSVPVLPDSFLGGSAPRLQFLSLTSIPFPGLPKFLLTATHFVQLHLVNIPHSGYISPDAMATCLSSLTSLGVLELAFESSQSSPDQESRRSPSPTCFVLPALTIFLYKGVNEYFEELVAYIDTPRLYQFSATFFNDIDFDTPELTRLVSHSSYFQATNETHVVFDNQNAMVKLQSEASNEEYFQINVSCREPDWQLSALAQICAASLPLLSTMDRLFIYEPSYLDLDWKDDIENNEWWDLLLPFTAVKDLYVSKQFAPRVAPVLQEITEVGAIELLSSLQNLYLEGFRPSESVEEGIRRFISARQLTNRPVAISVWDRID